MLSTMPPDSHCCFGGQRQQLEAELIALWRMRTEIVRALEPRQTLLTS
jgi:hypothetical protein